MSIHTSGHLSTHVPHINLFIQPSYLSIHTYHFHLIPKNADDLEDMFLTYLTLVDYNLLYLPNPRNNNNTINIWTHKLKYNLTKFVIGDDR